MHMQCRQNLSNYGHAYILTTASAACRACCCTAATAGGHCRITSAETHRNCRAQELPMLHSCKVRFLRSSAAMCLQWHRYGYGVHTAVWPHDHAAPLPSTAPAACQIIRPYSCSTLQLHACQPQQRAVSALLPAEPWPCHSKHAWPRYGRALAAPEQHCASHRVPGGACGCHRAADGPWLVATIRCCCCARRCCPCCSLCRSVICAQL